MQGTGPVGARDASCYASGPVGPSAAHRHAARRRGDVAQLEEHRVRIAGVRGSSPLISTTHRPELP